MKSFIKIAAAMLLTLAAGFAAAGAYEDALDAVEKDNAKVLTGLLQKGLDPNTSDAEGNTLLMKAARGGKLGTLKTLLGSGAKVNQSNAVGETALSLAAIGGQQAAARELMAKGAAVNPEGWKPLIYAAVYGNVEMMKVLLGGGAQINGQAENGMTALMMAAHEGQMGAVKFLVAGGADLNMRNGQERTALGIARQRGKDDIAAVLVQAGAKE